MEDTVTDNRIHREEMVDESDEKSSRVRFHSLKGELMREETSINHQVATMRSSWKKEEEMQHVSVRML